MNGGNGSERVTIFVGWKDMNEPEKWAVMRNTEEKF